VKKLSFLVFLLGTVALQNLRLQGEERAGDAKVPAGFKQDATPEPKAEVLDINASFQETPGQHDSRMKWWREARFGMFVHWGLFSAAGGTWHGKKSTFLGCWMQTSLKIPKEEYAAELMPKFTGEHFDPDFIARLAEETGVKYIIPIAKHHEGFALFDSKVTDYKITNTPAKRDWIRELSDASRRRGLKVGYYYSQNLDWHHTGEGWTQDRYVNELVLPQLKELLSNYGDLSILWFDIPGGVINADRAKSIVEMTKRLQPGIVINNRLGGGFKGDIQTPEQFIAFVSPEGKEVAWIDDLSALPQDMREVITQEIASREVMPTIERIVSVSTLSTPSTWDIVTDRGATKLILKGEEDIRRLPGSTLIITDSHGLRFVLPDMQALDKNSRRILDRFL
jgi:hypothetical protein